ncbi:Holliday junction branch migration DNA helicase RuvB [Candidatus Haliotispira prima]|uniref:Holliday junction branch migration complex subunit RuvB n=1 Tax=Candidatus Haliotispira prima TaxID=3034016 RepID=A0ABY8MNL6_9SPIO|nr:Holliday junction branch migration DNA helicase RuvB [Candidatus Haliotispira prima]
MSFDSSLLQNQFQDDDFPEESLRPKCLLDFRGQSLAKENLSVYIRAALERKEALDHVFISGPPGLGKTTLAGIIANEMGAEFRATGAPALEKAKDLAGLLTSLSPNSVFFIDEIHRLRPTIEEMLYIAMEDGELDWIIGEGPAARAVRVPLPPFTLVGATTRPGAVSSPLITRFGIQQRLNYYSITELEEVIIHSAKLLPSDIRADAATLLAQCSRGTPRVAIRLLRRMRDYAQEARSPIITRKVIEHSLVRLEIDRLGLVRLDREILHTIIHKFGGGPVGVETLAIAVGESRGTLEDFYEPYLIQCGLLQRSSRGRIATGLAHSHLEENSV